MKSNYYIPNSQITRRTQWSGSTTHMDLKGSAVVKTTLIGDDELKIQRMEILPKSYQKALATAIFETSLFRDWIGG